MVIHAEAPYFWGELLLALREQISPQLFKIWIEPVQASFEDEVLVLHVPNFYFQEELERHYLPEIQSIAEGLHQAPLRVEVRFDEQAKEQPVSTASAEHRYTEARRVEDSGFLKPLLPPRLNERYTFESFVVGPSNQFAHAACMAVAREPAGSYNPLFIYGGVGLGKTHLLHAIGWSLHQHPHSARVLYISSEQFVNEMITAVRLDKLSEFRSRYRDQCDILMLDDIQFIAGKKMTQEEFFHTFNFLYSSNKQIVLTSDRYPQEIPALEERLRSRFQWGLIADIQEPELETRMAIVTQKAESDALCLSNDVILFLASSMQNNIRELEGALLRLRAFHDLSGKEITLRVARDVLQKLVVTPQPVASIEMIQRVVSKYYEVSLADLKSSKRNKQILLPRQVAMYLCRKLAQSSYAEIGSKFGGKDHSTAINACQRVKKMLKKDMLFRQQMKVLETQVQED